MSRWFVVTTLWALAALPLASQDVRVDATITDTAGNSYELTDVSRHGHLHFNGVVANARVRLDFDRLASVDILPDQDRQGRLAVTVAFRAGPQYSMEILLANESLTGFEETLGVSLTIPLRDIDLVTFR